MSQARAIFGSNAEQRRASWKRLGAWFHRSDFIIVAGVWTLVLLGLFIFALYDFTSSAKRKDQEIQETTLRGELADFLLRTRDPDGSSLLENPKEFTMENRPLQVVSLKRPFFSYFLTKRNVKNFQIENLRFEPPRACALDFTVARPGRALPSHVFQACFAAVHNDPAGHYIYFSIRYPSGAIQRHQRGKRLSESDRLVLKFVGSRETKLVLVPEQPPQASARIPGLSSRFDGFHEVAAFTADDVGRPTRAVNAQAFERNVEGSDERIVTVLGRIDVSLFPGTEDVGSVWPAQTIKALRIGVQVVPAPNGRQESQYGFEPGTLGRANASLERAYIAVVPSRAELVVTSGGESGSSSGASWRSSDIAGTAPSGSAGWFQLMGKKLARFFVTGTERVSVKQQQSVSGIPLISATLTADAIVIPDIAARALVWLVAAFITIALMSFQMWVVFTRLQRLTRTAYAVARAHRAGSLEPYAQARDQIGTLGRVMYVLFKRDRNRMTRHRRRLEGESQQRDEDMRKEQELVNRRHSILLAIGHEIKSPLGNLLSSIGPEMSQHRDLVRMKRAIEALYEANRIEDGLRNGSIVVDAYDLAQYLNVLASNPKDRGFRITYVGPSEGVVAVFDDIALEQVIDELIDNACRYALAGTDIELRLISGSQVAIVEVFNHGPHIPDLERIFGLGVTDQSEANNLGLGLYAAQVRMIGMNGHIWAENRPSGVALVLNLPIRTR